MSIMSLRSLSRVNVSIMCMRADNYFIHNHLRPLLNIILITYIYKYISILRK